MSATYFLRKYMHRIVPKYTGRDEASFLQANQYAKSEAIFEGSCAMYIV